MSVLDLTPKAFSRRYPKQAVALILSGMFVISCILRFVIALFASENPSIMPDESLYMGISRSIFDGFNIQMTGQPVRYEYILYPLLLSPLHLLPQSINIFRAMQLLNCIMMSLGVFFAYLIAKEILTSRKKALLIALVSLILPDFVMSVHIMSESVAYPLVLLSIYLGLKCINNESSNAAPLAAGIVSALLYFVKPGLVASGGVLLIILIFYAVKYKSRRRLLQAVSVLVGFLLVFAIVKLLLYTVMSVNPGQKTLYGSQTAPFTFEHLKQTLNGLFLYLTYIPLAFCLVLLLLPLSQLMRFKGTRRAGLVFVLGTLAVIVVGTVYMIYVDELRGELDIARIHVRYVAALLPVLCAYCLTDEIKNARLNTPFIVLSALSTAGLLFYGTAGLKSGRDYPVDAILLSLFTFEDGALNYHVLFGLIAFSLLFAAGYYLYRRKNQAVIRCLASITVVAVLLLTNITGYLQNMHAMDKKYTADAMEVKSLVPENPVLAVADGDYFKQTRSALEVPYRSDFMLTELSSLIDSLGDNGELLDFVPSSYWHTSGQNYINADGKLIFTYTALDMVHLNDSVKLHKTQNGLYQIATIAPGRPLMESAISHTSDHYAAVGTLITVFDSALKQSGRITLRLKAYTDSGSATLTLTHGQTSRTFNITSEKDYITTSFEVSDPDARFEISLKPEGERVYLDSYTVTAGAKV